MHYVLVKGTFQPFLVFIPLTRRLSYRREWLGTQFVDCQAEQYTLKSSGRGHLTQVLVAIKRNHLQGCAPIQNNLAHCWLATGIMMPCLPLHVLWEVVMLECPVSNLTTCNYPIAMHMDLKHGFCTVLPYFPQSPCSCGSHRHSL